MGKTDADLLPSADAAPLIAAKRCVLETGAGAQGEFTVTRGGTQFVFYVIIEPLRDSAGTVIGLTSAATDITEHKRIEEALRENDRRKNEFLAMLSHELRNPLATIRNGFFLLKRSEPGSAAYVRASQMIERQVDHLTRHVNDLLDLTRISQGRIQVHRVPLDLVELARQVADDFQELFDRAGVRLELDLPDRALWVEGDRTRLVQVVSNLLENAAKFTGDGGTTRLSVACASDSALIQVCDTGPGLPPEVLPRLFEPFVQADVPLDRSKGGLGLGLSLVRGLVLQHGGSVEARNNHGERGAEVVVRLPLLGDPSPDDSGAGSGGSEMGGAQSTHEPPA